MLLEREEPQNLSSRNESSVLISNSFNDSNDKVIKETLEGQGLSISDLADKAKESTFYYEKLRKEMEAQGIDDKWIISNLKDIAENAMTVTKEGVFPDYKARRRAVLDLSNMAKKSGSMEGISSIIKQMMVAQGAKGGDGSTFNFNKFLYNNNIK